MNSLLWPYIITQLDWATESQTMQGSSNATGNHPPLVFGIKWRGGGREINLNILSQLSQSICCDKLPIAGATINVVINSLFLKYQASSLVPMNQVSHVTLQVLTLPLREGQSWILLWDLFTLGFGLIERNRCLLSWPALRTKDLANSLSARSVGRAFLRAQRVTGHHTG